MFDIPMLAQARQIYSLQKSVKDDGSFSRNAVMKADSEHAFIAAYIAHYAYTKKIPLGVYQDRADAFVEAAKGLLRAHGENILKVLRSEDKGRAIPKIKTGDKDRLVTDYDIVPPSDAARKQAKELRDKQSTWAGLKFQRPHQRGWRGVYKSGPTQNQIFY